jgi:hypothetical protein
MTAKKHISILETNKIGSKMKKIIVSAVLFCGVCTTYSQQDCLDRVGKQAVVIDSLEKVITNDLNTKNLLTDTINDLLKKIKSLQIEVSDEKQKVANLDKNKVKDENDKLRRKVDSLNTIISEQHQTVLDKDKEITAIGQQAQQEKERGKQEALANIVNFYNKPFDDLIKFSTKESVNRDLRLMVNNAEIKQVLIDLQNYFNVKESLSKKFDTSQITNAQTQLNQIKRKSALLDDLKNTVGKYQTINKGLIATINKLVALDNEESVTGMSDEIKKEKFYKIMSEISAYIFNYDFNLTDYPYLSNIVLEIIKRKYPKPDADITDLLEKL